MNRVEKCILVTIGGAVIALTGMIISLFYGFCWHTSALVSVGMLVILASAVGAFIAWIKDDEETKNGRD